MYFVLCNPACHQSIGRAKIYPCSDGATSDEEGKKCASLRLDGKLTIQALAFPTQWRRRPDSFGGKVRDDQAFLQPCSVQRKLLQDAWQARGSPPDDDISCVELPIGDFQSWMLKLDMPFVYDSSDVNFQLKIAEADDSLLVQAFEAVNGTVASFFARVFQAVTAFSFAGCVDPADIVCHETDFASFLRYVTEAKWFGVNNLFGNPQLSNFSVNAFPAFKKIFPDKDLPFPTIRMRAVDVAGNGVPGLRVRLNVFDSIYPNMPPVARMITCSLLKGKDGDIPAENAVPIEGMSPNEVTEMRQKKQLVCETDANGYVNMRVSHPVWRYVGDPNVAEPELFPIEVNMPEYIESSSSGTIFYEYSAYRPVYDTSKTLVKLERACSIALQMDVNSQVASVEWADHRPCRRGHLRGQPATSVSTPSLRSRRSFLTRITCTSKQRTATRSVRRRVSMSLRVTVLYSVSRRLSISYLNKMVKRNRQLSG